LLPHGHDPLRARLSAIAGATSEQIDCASRIQWLGLSRIVQPQTALEEENQPVGAIHVIRRGWAFSSKLLADGGRQIIDFHVAGDVVGASGLFLATACKTGETITETVVTEVSADSLKRAARASPVLFEALLVLAGHERVRMADRLVDLGRRDSIARVGRLFLELWRRLSVVGLAKPRSYACPLSQYLVADALGLTAIHVNRVLRELREGGLLTFRRGIVTFNDFDRLVELTGFDAGPFDLTPRRPTVVDRGAA
jgi:CRP-like cAMP-binding protein